MLIFLHGCTWQVWSFPRAAPEGTLYLKFTYCPRKAQNFSNADLKVCLPLKCKCHFITSLVTKPSLAFLRNNISQCSFFPTYAPEGARCLLCLVRLAGRLRLLQTKYFRERIRLHFSWKVVIGYVIKRFSCLFASPPFRAECLSQPSFWLHMVIASALSY